MESFLYSGDFSGVVIKMEESSMERQGRVLIPRKVREALRLRVGERLSVRTEGRKIILQPLENVKDFSDRFCGCITKSSLDPLDVKKMWRM